MRQRVDNVPTWIGVDTSDKGMVRLLDSGLKNRPRKFPLESVRAVPGRAKIWGDDTEVADD